MREGYSISANPRCTSAYSLGQLVAFPGPWGSFPNVASNDEEAGEPSARPGMWVLSSHIYWKGMPGSVHYFLAL